MRARSILRGIVSGLLFAAWGGAAGAADIRVLATAAIRGAFETLIPQFERASGHKASVVYGASAGLKTRIDGGEAFDVCVLTGAQIDDLVKQTKVVEIGRAHV